MSDSSVPPVDADSQKLRLAFVGHELVDAALSARYRLPNKAEGTAKLKQLARYFTHDSLTDDTLTLWVRGFALTPDEITARFMGNFAVLRLQPINPDDRWTITAKKLDMPLSDHPQKARIQHRHPNWAHPIMATIRKKKLYDSMEDARLVLDKLHHEFPTVSIPGPDKLAILVYSKSAAKEEKTQENSEIKQDEKPVVRQPIVRIQLRVLSQEDGTHYIDWSERGKNRRPTGGSRVAAQDPKAIAAMAAMIQATR
jgi:hypothetical protein